MFTQIEFFFHSNFKIFYFLNFESLINFHDIQYIFNMSFSKYDNDVVFKAINFILNLDYVHDIFIINIYSTYTYIVS